MNKNEPMNLIIGASREYASFTAVMLESLFRNNKGEKFNIFFYYDEPMDDIFNDLTAMSEKVGSTFTPVYVDESRRKNLTINNLSWWHNSIWYRYYCVEDLHDKFDRALIIGTDTIIQKEIRPFYDTDLGDKCMMGVIDMGAAYGTANVEECIKHNYDTENYINSDILLIDLKKAYGLIDVNNMLKQYIDNKLWALDQDVINFYYGDHVLVSNDIRYNFVPAVASNPASKITPDFYRKKLEEAVIIHYAEIKPWSEPNELCAHSIWYDYAKDLYNYQEILGKVIRLTAANVQKRKKHMRKMDMLFWIQDLLWDACDNDTVKEQLKNNNIKSIAIYGYGKLGKHLLKYCREKAVDVKYIIDSAKTGTADGIPIINPDDIIGIDKADAVIVTPIQDFEDIKKMLESKCSKVISLEEIV